LNLVAALPLTDLIVGIVCGLAAIRGFLKGFAWQVVKVLGLVAALWGASLWHEAIGDRLAATFSFIPDAAAPLVAWVLLFVALYLVATYVAWLARGAVRRAQMGSLDRVLGLAAGAAWGLLLCAFGFLAAAGLFLDDDEARVALEESITGPWIVRAVRLVEPALPDELRRRWGGVLAVAAPHD
jgi:uncharacterized membrane protein required for colicin V production